MSSDNVLYQEIDRLRAELAALTALHEAGTEPYTKEIERYQRELAAANKAREEAEVRVKVLAKLLHEYRMAHCGVVIVCERCERANAALAQSK